jgi:hypothetical protein
MYKESQVLKIKPGQEQEGLPSEVTVVKIEGEAVHVKSDTDTFESTVEILETFYTLKEEFSLLTMPKMSVEAIDDVLAHFDLYAASESPLAGLQVKTKLLALKDNISKVAGIKSTVSSLLGKKIA